MQNNTNRTQTRTFSKMEAKTKKQGRSAKWKQQQKT